jgi:glutathione synthase/RimK-type ligase-like ATP-grasp enzyme
VPVELTPELRRLVDACAAAFDLDLLGIDVLETDRGLLVVDVNEFPNYTGVEPAVAAIADLVADATQLVAA